MQGSRWLAVAAVAALLLVLGESPGLAHPPDNPYDDTVFAPIHDNAGVPVGLELAAGGFTAPVNAATAPGEPGRLYVVDQAGLLWAVDLLSGANTRFLDLTGRLVPLGVLGPGTLDERGFLGVAFHPDYQSNGRFYTYTSEPNGGSPTFATTLPPDTAASHQNIVAEWRAVEPGNPAAGVYVESRRELLRIDWPQFNHNGGDITFGPDGKLFIPTGDGGGADDMDGDLGMGPPGSIGHSGDGNAQKLFVPLGKILRIDIDGTNSANGQYGIPDDNPFTGTPGAVREIWAYGLRNPSHISFDTATGVLVAGDVGQNDLEEVDVIVKGGNYGWNRKEGALCFDDRGDEPGVATEACDALPPLPADLVDPVFQYDKHHEGHAVVGGFVYRGRALSFLRGRYVFAERSRLTNVPSGPDNYGRILYVEEKTLTGGRLATIKEFRGFADEAAELGLTDPSRPPNAFPQTLSVLGSGQDASGELYILGNDTGLPFGTRGVVLKIVNNHR